jgi:hypothetical protein
MRAHDRLARRGRRRATEAPGRAAMARRGTTCRVVPSLHLRPPEVRAHAPEAFWFGDGAVPCEGLRLFGFREEAVTGERAERNGAG